VTNGLAADGQLQPEKYSRAKKLPAAVRSRPGCSSPRQIRPHGGYLLEDR
jgi:hypothetical protein